MSDSQERKLIYDPLVEFMAHYADAKSAKKESSGYESLSVEERLKQRIIDGDKIGLDKDLELARKDYEPLNIINDILLGGMKVVGELFGAGEMQLPFVLQSAETMKAAVGYLEPYMEKTGGDISKGRMVLATVKGDVHDIGKNLVDIILTNNGYTVYNLGIKVSLEQMLEEFEHRKADAIGMSGLLVKSTAIMKENLEVMAGRGIEVPVILGGAALTRKFVEQDLRALYGGTLAYAQDAFDGLHFMEKLKFGDVADEALAAAIEHETLREMLAAMEASRAQLLEVLSVLEESDYHIPEAFGKWSLRDVIAHIIEWEKLAIERSAILRQGLLPQAIDSSEVDGLNDAFVARNISRTKAALLGELSEIRASLTAALEAITEEEFLRSSEAMVAMKQWLPHFSYAHELEHLQKIRNWVELRDEELDNATGEESKMILAQRDLPWLSGASIQPLTRPKAAIERVQRLSDVPTPPFWGVELRELWILDKVWEYLNEVALFRGQWQFKKGKKTTEEHRKLLEEIARPKLNELKLLCKQQHILQPKAVYGYFPCISEGDDVVILKPASITAEELLHKWDWHPTGLTNLEEYKRFTFPRQPSGKQLCISDFFLTRTEAEHLGKPDVISLTAVTIGRKASEYTAKLFESNQYADYLFLHGLSVETAEALAEYLHKIVRMELGIAGEDAATIERLFSQGYRGSRYSFGYPACPNLEDQTKLFDLIRPERIDITLTEEYHLEPEQSTTALICHHPEARYFGIK